MKSIKQIITILASLVFAGMVLNVPVASAQNAQGNFFCIPTYELLIKQTEERELAIEFVGMTRTGMALWFFANDTEFSVFFKDRVTGQYCTAPNYYGAIIKPMPTEVPTED